MSGSRSPDHFRLLYQSASDPWGFDTSPYEQAKYANSLSALGDRRFVAALEVGCSIGTLTCKLGERCDSVLGIDIVAEPLETARIRAIGQDNVRFMQMQVPALWPKERFDLIVLSEVLYFLTPDDIDRCAQRVLDTLQSPGVVLLVNWLGQSDDPCTGDEAADRFIAATAGALKVDHYDRQPGYRLDRLVTTVSPQTAG